MPVTTWSFVDGYEDWTFALGSASTAGSAASSTHVPGAIRVTATIPAAPPANRSAQADLTSSQLNATIANLDTIALDYGAVTGTLNITSIRITATYTDATTETIIAVGVAGPGTLTLTLTQNKTLDNILVRNGILSAGPAETETVNFEEVRLTTAAVFTGTGQKPLGLDVDLESGGKIYTTYWDGDLGGDLMLREYNSAIVLQNTYTIANNTATIADISARTFFISPYTPPFFGTASLDDIIYIYGRWDDGAVKHLAKSTDGGASFTDIGDSATWGADWVGGFFADNADTLYAFLNGASPALYRSLDAGSSWTSLSALPFDVDPHSVSKHPDGRILIANRIAGSQMVAYAESPGYSSWVNATGSPSFSTGGLGARSIVWVT